MSKHEFIKFATQSKIDPYKDYLTQAPLMGQKLTQLLAQDTRDILQKMGTTGSPSVVLLKNVPMDSYIPAEVDPGIDVRSHNKMTRVSENFMLGISHLMNCDIKANERAYNGSVFHNVAPRPGLEHTQSSSGKEPLYLHTEEAFDLNPPDFLMLYCLVGDPESKTSYYHVKDFKDKIPKDIIESMEKPIFTVMSNEGSAPIRYENTHSLITNDPSLNGKTRLRLYSDMKNVKPKDESVQDEALNVINFFNQFFHQEDRQSVALEAGDVLIFNNAIGHNKLDGILHGREGEIQNMSRWLQRSFLYQKKI